MEILPEVESEANSSEFFPPDYRKRPSSQRQQREQKRRSTEQQQQQQRRSVEQQRQPSLRGGSGAAGAAGGDGPVYQMPLSNDDSFQQPSVDYHDSAEISDIDDYYNEADTPRSRRSRTYSDGADPLDDHLPQLPLYNDESQRSFLSGVTTVSGLSSQHLNTGTSSELTPTSTKGGGTPPPPQPVLSPQNIPSPTNGKPVSNRSISARSLLGKRLSARLSEKQLPYNNSSEESKGDAHHELGLDGTVHEVPLKSIDLEEEWTKRPKSSLTMGNALYGESTHTINTMKSMGDITPKKQDIDSNSDEKITLSEPGPIVVWGIVLPLCCSPLIFQTLTMSRVSNCIVRAAPCFWCCGNDVNWSSSDRAVLSRLNVLVIFFAFIQFFAAMWLAALLIIVDDETTFWQGIAPHFWNCNGMAFCAGLIGLFVIVTCFCTIRVIQEVDLVGAIRLLWMILWLIPFEIFFNISLFDYHGVTSVWIRHWWLESPMAWFRRRFCRDDTFETKCLVPIDGGFDYDSEIEWCLQNYNATDCTMYRDHAQARTAVALTTFYTILAVWGILLMSLMLLMVNSLERIISRPIVQKSRESSVPSWLTLPIVGCGVVGALFLYAPSSLLSSSSGTKNSWIGVAYIVSGALFLVAALLGWFLSTFSIESNVDKKNKNFAILIFIGIMAANTIMLATLFIGSIVLSADLEQEPLDSDIVTEIACYVLPDVGGCTSCDSIGKFSIIDGCPEWLHEDISKILRTQLKQSATLAAIFISYAISVLRFGFVLRNHLAMYQIDYI